MKDELVLPEDLDLNEIFIGRERQLNDFHAYLEKWLRSVSISSPPPLTMPPAPNNRIQGLFVLLHGRGGFGKSTLLQHYRQIALEYRHELLASKTVDWSSWRKIGGHFSTLLIVKTSMPTNILISSIDDWHLL